MRVSRVDIELKFLDRLVVGLEVQVVPLVVRAGHDGVVAYVCVAGSPSHLVRTSGYGNVMAEVGARIAEHLPDPVVALDSFVKADVLVQSEVWHVLVFIVAPDHGKLVLVLHEAVRILYLDGILVRHPFLSPVGIVAHGELAACTAFCRHEDHTVGTAGSVDGSREGILQDVNALDVGCRYVGDALDRESVHYIKR